MSNLAAFRSLRFLPACAGTQTQGDDTLYLRHPDPLLQADADLVAMLNRCSQLYGERRFLAERVGDGWSGISFADFGLAVERVANGMEREGLVAGMRVGILSGNSIAHAIATFAVMAVGGVTVPLQPAYMAHAGGGELLSRLARTAGVSMLLYDERLPAASFWPKELPSISLSRVWGWADADADGPKLAQRARVMRSGSSAKIFFTSGSTGTPKAIVNTHRMLAAAAAMVEQASPRLPPEESPVIVDWLPWTHTFGGNANLHWALLRGAAFHIDAGAPVPGRFDESLRNLGEVRPTSFTTVPAGYPLLLDALERDAELAVRFFSRLGNCGFGGAALSAAVIERFQSLALRVCGRRMPFGGGYGMTETAGIIALVWWDTDRGDLLGLPLPGVELKLVRREGSRWECRVRGPNLFAGYQDSPAIEPFDEEGYFITGDAVELADPEHPVQGLVYSGRLGEDFKLASGTWVRAGKLREQLLDHLRPIVSDLALFGESRDEIAALVWIAADQNADVAHGALLVACREFNRDRRGATERIGRMAISERLPDASAGEVTAKGTLNLRRLADNRRVELERIHADPAFLV